MGMPGGTAHGIAGGTEAALVYDCGRLGPGNGRGVLIRSQQRIWGLYTPSVAESQQKNLAVRNKFSQ